LVESADVNAAPDLTLNYTGFVRSLTGNTLTLHGYNTDADLEKVHAWFIDGSANVSSSGWVPVAANHNGDLVLTLSGAANLADITGIKVEIMGDAGADFNVSSITTVPEPTTAVLAGLGLLGFLGFRHFRRA
jgi:hypothetical protein